MRTCSTRQRSLRGRLSRQGRMHRKCLTLAPALADGLQRVPKSPWLGANSLQTHKRNAPPKRGVPGVHQGGEISPTRTDGGSQARIRPVRPGCNQSDSGTPLAPLWQQSHRLQGTATVTGVGFFDLPARVKEPRKIRTEVSAIRFVHGPVPDPPKSGCHGALPAGLPRDRLHAEGVVSSARAVAPGLRPAGA